MKYQISNRHLKVAVNHIGAELSSIKSIATNKEYMWQADPNVWGSFAPVLFPAIGSFKNDACTIDGKEYKVPKHGFIRHNQDLKVVEESEIKLSLGLEYSEKTLATYPYKFRFTITFELIEKKLIINHRIENLDNRAIHFSLGGHPAFNLNWNEDAEISNYYLEFEKLETASRTLLSVEGLISDKTELVLDNTKTLDLNPTLFNDDALIFKDLESKKVSLKCRKSSQVLTVSYSDFNYLGIWAKPNAPFVCIEPWLGIADHEDTDGDFLKKDGLISLPKEEVFEASFEIEICE